MQILLRTLRQFAAASICLMLIGAMAGTNTVFTNVVFAQDPDPNPNPIEFATCKDTCCDKDHKGKKCDTAPAGCDAVCSSWDCNGQGTAGSPYRCTEP